jgi:glycosyltransferase involved in cell wall biosynthesis
MKILFLDQSGQVGGAELSLLDIAKTYGGNCLVGLFESGPYQHLLVDHNIPVQVFSQSALNIQRESNFLRSLSSLKPLAHLVNQVIKLSYQYDVIYANTAKAFVIGALASLLTHRPLIYHLRDILSADHFSAFNRRLIVNLANCCAAQVITNSYATQAAFVAAGGRADLTEVIYNGFKPTQYQNLAVKATEIKQQLNLADHFVIGHFSRLSPWKGQHVLLEALPQCPKDTIALLVGDALFGEQAYVQQLHQQVNALGLQNQVRFLGFKEDIPAIMAACDLVAHTSTAPEPFGRVIVEGVLCGKPVVASAAGGATELIEHGKTGWLTPPGDVDKLAEVINCCHRDSDGAAAIAHQGQKVARQRFDLNTTNEQVEQLLNQVMQHDCKIAVTS